MAKQKPLKSMQTKIKISYEGDVAYHVKGVVFFQICESDDNKGFVFVYTTTGVDSHGNEFETTKRIPMKDITSIRADFPDKNPLVIQVYGGQVWSYCEFATKDPITMAHWCM